ncbi:addiction module protein [Comamonas faecalis]
MNAIYQEIEKLTPAEKLDLVEALWDDIARTRAQVPIPEATEKEVLRRAAWRQSHPGQGKSLEEIIQTLGVRL